MPFAVSPQFQFSKDFAKFAPLQSGGYIVTYGEDASVVGQVLDAAGTSVGDPFLLFGQEPDPYDGTSKNFDLLALPNGNLVALSLAILDGGALKFVRGAVIDATGKRVGSDFSFLGEIHGDGVVLDDGTLAAVATNLDPTSPLAQIGLLSINTSTGSLTGKFFGETTLGYPAAQVAATSNGALVVVWEKAMATGALQLVAQSFDTSGKELGPTFEVSKNLLIGLGTTLCSAAGLTNGNFVVGWNAENPNGVFGEDARLRFFNDKGVAITDEITIRRPNLFNLGDQKIWEVVDLRDGRIAVLWSDITEGKTFMQLMDYRGKFSGDSFAVKTADGQDIGPASDVQLVLREDGKLLLNVTSTNAGVNSNVVVEIDSRNFVGTPQKDMWFGGDKNETLQGNDRDDFLIGGLGADILDGGQGTDTASYYRDAGVRVDLSRYFANTGAASGDTFIDIESLFGSNTGADRLYGNRLDNTLSGAGGNDKLYGRGGADVLRGGLGKDQLSGGEGNDQFRYLSSAEIGDTIMDFASGDQFAFGRRGFPVASLTGLYSQTVNETVPGPVKSIFFHSGTTNLAADTNDFLIFRTTDGTLWFDLDGSRSASPVLIADLANDYQLTANDIIIL